jgi:maltose/moltooligosaccharide transporter
MGRVGHWCSRWHLRGIFNFFITLPEISASLAFGWIMNHVLHNNRLAAVIAGGVFMALAAALMQRVADPGTEDVAVAPMPQKEVAI